MVLVGPKRLRQNIHLAARARWRLTFAEQNVVQPGDTALEILAAVQQIAKLHRQGVGFLGADA